ncbi:enoyl-CoA hydratase/isomerase family protein [Streptomyces qinglanensis]|uniref:enoyl-CoA hydratase/isomerase family protein n=1 Tax=Streptomyces qinglanensis TaxID=943816 RepID=UPI003D7040EC
MTSSPRDMSRAEPEPAPGEAPASESVREGGSVGAARVRGAPGEEPPECAVAQATRNAVSWITLDRPHTLNALTWAQRERLVALLADASADPGVRAVVLTGRGRGFCSGADLRSGSGGGTGGGAGDGAGHGAGSGERVTGDVARTLERGAQRLIAAVLDCEKPVLAAVNGTAAGLGCHLALACDLVLAAEEASFVEVFVRRGLVPDGGGAYLLAGLVGPRRAKELMFFGDALPAAEAERLGLVNRVVPAAALEQTAREWAERLAAGPTRALALTKRLVDAAQHADRSAAFSAEAWAQEINMTTRDAREGVAAFVERRDPAFEGR